MQEIDESGILRYNYAVALQLAGKRHQSASLLEEIFQNKDNIDDYVLIKASLTLLVKFIKRAYHKILVGNSDNSKGLSLN